MSKLHTVTFSPARLDLRLRMEARLMRQGIDKQDKRRVNRGKSWDNRGWNNRVKRIVIPHRNSILGLLRFVVAMTRLDATERRSEGSEDLMIEKGNRSNRCVSHHYLPFFSK